jgi:hypothetical protein
MQMIKRSKQNWEIGEVVKVGLLSGLTVVAKIPTPGDYAPDAYALSHAKTGRVYRFTPHLGIERCASMNEALAA